MIRYCGCCGDIAYYEIDKRDGIYQCVGVGEESVKVPVIDGKIMPNYLMLAASELCPEEEDLDKIVISATDDDDVLIVVTDDYCDRLFTRWH